MKYVGWRNDSHRHGLAARGIRTRHKSKSELRYLFEFSHSPLFNRRGYYAEKEEASKAPVDIHEFAAQERRKQDIAAIEQNNMLREELDKYREVAFKVIDEDVAAGRKTVEKGNADKDLVRAVLTPQYKRLNEEREFL